MRTRVTETGCQVRSPAAGCARSRSHVPPVQKDGRPRRSPTCGLPGDGRRTTITKSRRGGEPGGRWHALTRPIGQHGAARAERAQHPIAILNSTSHYCDIGPPAARLNPARAGSSKRPALPDPPNAAGNERHQRTAAAAFSAIVCRCQRAFRHLVCRNRQISTPTRPRHGIRTREMPANTRFRA